MKPTTDQRRILRLFVTERVLARGFSGLRWLDPDAERPTETVNALTCAFFKVDGDQIVLTEWGRWTARDMATSLLLGACNREGRLGEAWRKALEHAATKPYYGPLMTVVEHAARITECARLLTEAEQTTRRLRVEMRAWEDLVPRPRPEARMAKHIPGYVPKVPLMVCGKHRKVNDE